MRSNAIELNIYKNFLQVSLVTLQALYQALYLDPNNYYEHAYTRQKAFPSKHETSATATNKMISVSSLQAATENVF